VRPYATFFCIAKNIIIQAKGQPTEWEKNFTNSTSDREFISKTYKEIKRLNIKQTTQFKNGA
jgi:CRISPR/Cas system endoribonuclease Cas6 (RAMP superfamily)